MYSSGGYQRRSVAYLADNRTFVQYNLVSFYFYVIMIMMQYRSTPVMWIEWEYVSADVGNCI